MNPECPQCGDELEEQGCWEGEGIQYHCSVCDQDYCIYDAGGKLEEGRLYGK